MCGSALAPVIQFATNCVYQLLKAIQSVVYALFKVNIFANASASAFKNAQKQAKNTSKSLSSVHSEINNVGDHNSDASPNVGDLSSIDNQMSPLSQKLYDFFKPLVDSWNKYGATLIEQIKTTAGQIASLISSVWESVEKLITNGTVYTSLELILAIIGNIAEAFSNAWNYNDNGDVIVQNLANAFNNLLTAINNVVQSEGFQNWLNNCSDKFRVISEKIASINWQPMVDALTNIGQNIGTIALDILRGLVDIFKWLVENPVVSEIILGIAVAIGVLSTAYSIWATVTGVLTAVSTALNIAILPLIAIIVAIVAVIALIVVAVMNWGTITEWLKEKWTQVKQFFSDLKQRIYDIFSNIGKWFGDKFNEAKESVMNAFSNIGNWFGDRKNDITNAFSNIGSWFSGKFQDAYNGVTKVFSKIGTFFKNIWNDIKNTFTNLGTSIGNAISGAVKTGINGVISLIEKTINTAIRLINGGIKLINLIPGVSVGTINTLNLPRLAKGNVAYDETLAIFGEYSGASNNPEITTPQNIMRDTFEDVLSNYGGNNQPISLNLTVNVSNKKLGQILLDDLRDKTRRTGKDIEALVGG
nr:MAG TPA: minor tail protein [Caudoviricetes sp.]